MEQCGGKSLVYGTRGFAFASLLSERPKMTWFVADCARAHFAKSFSQRFLHLVLLGMQPGTSALPPRVASP
jgi:hypothetical protein